MIQNTCNKGRILMILKDSGVLTHFNNCIPIIALIFTRNLGQ